MPLGVILFEDVPQVEFMYLVFTRMPGENYRRRLKSLLFCLYDVFRALINHLCVDSVIKSSIFVLSHGVKQYITMPLDCHVDKFVWQHVNSSKNITFHITKDYL